jgi:acetyl-CoA acetyltransferase family protein
MSSLKNHENFVFVAAKRTPFGAFGASLASLTATDLAVHAAQACLDQSGLRPDEIDATVLGNVVQSSADAIYISRHTGLRLGMPEDRPALTVNRLCGSGFEAIAQGAYLLAMEGAKAVLVGGTESMSQVPYVLRGARWGYRMGNNEVEDFLTASLTDRYTGLPMAITAENLAERFKLTRDDVDSYALASQQRAARAWESGIFKDEVASITLKSKKGDTLFSRDEHLRPETTMQSLGKLKPVFKPDGVVTAGNASGIVDGAACLILATESFAKSRGLKVMGRLVTWASVGCDPKIMGFGPVPATRKALERYSKISGAKKSISDFKRIEVNEAFSPQYLAVEKELGLNREITNSNGGAISIGHPLAASGARLVGHLLYDLPRKGGGAGLATACIGGGQGMSVIVEV